MDTELKDEFVKDYSTTTTSNPPPPPLPPPPERKRVRESLFGMGFTDYLRERERDGGGGGGGLDVSGI